MLETKYLWSCASLFYNIQDQVLEIFIFFDDQDAGS